MTIETIKDVTFLSGIVVQVVLASIVMVAVSFTYKILSR